jgi:hypothetical protein
MTEKVGLEISLDAKQAQVELARTREAAEQLGGGLDRASRGFWTLDGAAKTLQRSLAPQAAAISNISASLGENAGQAGKAVAAAGQLAAAWAAGGPLGLATVGLSVAVVQLIAHWDDLAKAQDEALNKSFSATDQASALLRKAQEGNADLVIKISEQGLSAKELQISATNREIAATQAKIDAMRQEGKIWTDNEIAARGQLEQTIKLLQKRQRLIRMLPDEGGAGGAAPEVGNELADNATIGNIMRARAKKQAEQAAADRAEVAEMMWQEGLQQARDAARAADALEAERTRAYEAAQRERTQIAKAAEAERLRVEEEAARERVATVRGNTEMVTSIAVGGAQVAVDAVVSGQAHAFELVSSYLMAQAGSALIGSGIKLAGEAVVSGLTPGLQPVAAAQGAGAAALIGSGLALGGASAALGKLAIPAPGATSPTKTRSDSRESGVGTGPGGFGRASGGNGSYGQTVQVINVYGVSGPQAEDRARMTARDLWLANRRGMNR